MLVYILALPSGETDDVRWRQDNSPNFLLSYIRNYLSEVTGVSDVDGESKSEYKV